LIDDKAEWLQKEQGLAFSIVGIATRSHGMAINAQGLDHAACLATNDLSSLHLGEPLGDIFAFIAQVPAQVILEGTWVNPQTGQPATDYCRAALRAGKHLVTANKGPVAFAHGELTTLAAERGLKFFYESTVMDGAPIHSLRRTALLGAEVQGLRGILNSTTNSILSRMGEGLSFEAALAEMQAAGTAEADPSNDIEGWDAAIKLAILANTMMGADLRPAGVDRTGIRGLSAEDILAAKHAGEVYKLLCEAWRDSSGRVQAKVAPARLSADDPLAHLGGASSGLTIQTDVLGGLSILKTPSSPRSTAYGMFVDTLNILGRQQR
jgi:homoserine dehydrogenase